MEHVLNLRIQMLYPTLIKFLSAYMFLKGYFAPKCNIRMNVGLCMVASAIALDLNL